MDQNATVQMDCTKKPRNVTTAQTCFHRVHGAISQTAFSARTLSIFHPTSVFHAVKNVNNAQTTLNALNVKSATFTQNPNIDALKRPFLTAVTLSMGKK